jgi:hypothetical protein
MAGRPSTYTPEVEDEVMRRLASGESLNHICRDDHLPPESTVRSWTVDDKPPGITARYSHARAKGIDALGEIALEDASRPGMKPEEVAAAQLAWRARTWHMSKMRPDKYGDRTVLAGDKDAPLQFTVVDAAAK